MLMQSKKAISNCNRRLMRLKESMQKGNNKLLFNTSEVKKKKKKTRVMHGDACGTCTRAGGERMEEDEEYRP
jgi:hypothetical protein